MDPEGDQQSRRVRVALPRPGSPLALVAALGVVAFGVLFRLPLDAWAGEPLPPFITFSPAIVVAGFVGGLRAGFLSAGLSLLLAWRYWIAPVGDWQLQSRTDVLAVLVYVLTGSLMAWVSGSARLLYDKARANEIERAAVAREMVHRIKNLVAVIQALSRQIAKKAHTPQEFYERLEGKLFALGVAQDMLLRRDQQSVSIAAIVETTLAPFMKNGNLNVSAGPEVFVYAGYVNGLTMALYELATNALKYGGLAAPGGSVELAWSCSQGKCALIWREFGRLNDGVPGTGFGSRLIQAAFGGASNTHVDHEISADSVYCQFNWPLAIPKSRRIFKAFDM